MLTEEQFCRKLRGDGKSENTIKAYRKTLRLYFRWLDGLSVKDPVPSPPERVPTVENAEEFVVSRDLKPASIHRYRMQLRTYFNSCGVEIPKGRLKGVKANNIREDKFVTRKEVDQLYKSADNLRDKVAIRMLFHAGLRANELLAANVGDLDLENHRVYVKAKRAKGSHRIRSVRFIRPELVIPTLRSYLQQRGIDHKSSEHRETPLLLSNRGKRLGYSRLAQIITRYKNSIGKPDLSTHWLRHGFVVWNKRHGVPAEITALQIGDRIQTTQEIYSHYSQTDVDRVYDEIQGKIQEDDKANLSPIDELEEVKEKNKALEKRLEKVEKRGKVMQMALKILIDPETYQEWQELENESAGRV